MRASGRLPEVVLREPQGSSLSRPAWYVHRLRSMPARELPHRAAEQVQRLAGRRPGKAEGHVPTRRADTGLADLIRQWRTEPGVRSFWREAAARVGAGEITVFGARWSVSSAGVPDWDLDPLTGYRWPADYCFDVSPAPGDGAAEVKYVWELNRLVYLLPVAAAAAEDGNERARRTCRAHAEAWIHEHPARRGVVWRSGIELAIRVLSLVLVLELTARRRGDTACRPGDDAVLEELVGRAVAEHADWIRRFPSRHSSANNLRVAELAGLLVAAAAYPGLASAPEVADWWTEFESTAVQQFHADGVPAEQATAYGLLVLEWAAICLHLGRRQGRCVAVATRDRLRAAAGFLASVADTAGNVVRIGDDDDSRLLTAARPHGDHPRAVLGLLAQGLQVAAPAARAGLSTFADGGYTVWRSSAGPDEVLWVVDHGPLGLGHLAAHAHADTLSVYLHLAGRPVLVDAGTYLYHGSASWRRQLRSTRVHNTLAVAGEDSSAMAGLFNWRRSRRARGRLLSALSSAQEWRVEAEHDGYVRDHGVVHRRCLTGEGPGRFRLTDRLDGTSLVPVTWSLLVAAHLDVTETHEGWLVCDGRTPILRVEVPPGWRKSLRYGADGEGGGWCSPSFGRLLPSHRMVLGGRLGGPAELSVGLILLGTPRRPADVLEVDG